MKSKDGKVEIKVGDVIIGRSTADEVIVGPVISLSEERGTVTIGDYRANSNTVSIDRCGLADNFIAKAKPDKPTPPPAPPK